MNVRGVVLVSILALTSFGNMELKRANFMTSSARKLRHDKMALLHYCLYVLYFLPLRRALLPAPRPALRQALRQAPRPALRQAQLPLLKVLAPPHRPPPHLQPHLEPPCSIHMLTITTSNVETKPPIPVSLRRPLPALLVLRHLRRIMPKLPAFHDIMYLLTYTVTMQSL